jgi:hypothetical protein
MHIRYRRFVPEDEGGAVTNTFTRRIGAVLLMTAFTFTVTASGFAAEKSESSPAPSLLASGRAHVQQMSARAPARSPQALRQTTGGYDEPRAFFSTKRGVALLVLAGAGIGYMWYSKSHDRIHSTARERLDN